VLTKSAHLVALVGVLGHDRRQVVEALLEVLNDGQRLIENPLAAITERNHHYWHQLQNTLLN
jgi:hypothetical protein